MQKQPQRIIVIGGGASGLAAAIAAAGDGASVTILERLPRVGKKILLTGNGRCNLGNETIRPERVHGSCSFAAEMMQKFDTVQFFRMLGLYTRTDAEGRMYPMSGMAASVLDALRFCAEQRGVQMLCEMQVTGFSFRNGAWQVNCGTQCFSADAVIVAAGGCASPACGTDGSLFPVIKSLGIPVNTPKPALCAIPTDEKLVRPLKGLRVRAEAAAIVNGKCMKRETGEVQFTGHALSGICIFNLSRIAAVHGKKAEISLNLLPGYSPEQVNEMLRMLVMQRGALPASELLSGLLPKRIGEVWLRQIFGTLNAPAGELLHSDDARQRLTALLLDRRFPVTGTAPFAQAQVTAGGVSGEALSDSLEVKGMHGLYVCGEAADTGCDCGGYNLTWCWSSGTCAGHAAAIRRNL